MKSFVRRRYAAGNHDGIIIVDKMWSGATNQSLVTSSVSLPESSVLADRAVDVEGCCCCCVDELCGSCSAPLLVFPEVWFYGHKGWIFVADGRSEGVCSGGYVGC